MEKGEYWEKVRQRRLSRRRLLKVGGLAGGLWLASALGCGTSSEQAKTGNTSGSGPTAVTTPQPKYGGTLKCATNADPRSLDPHIETADASNITRGYNGLVTWNTEGTKIIPDLAVSWEQPDDVTYVFKLNQGVKFHNVPPVNGRELTADDVKFSITRMMSTQPAGKFTHASLFLGRLAKIDAVDKYTVKFTTTNPDVTFMSSMANVWTKIVAPEAVDKYGELTEVIIGTGPFMLGKRDLGVETVMVRNPDYFKKGLPYLDAISVKIIPDPTTAATAFMSGDLDWTTPQAAELDMIRKAMPNLPSKEGITMYPFVFRTQPYDDKRPLKPPVDDKRVRQALQLAINRQECIDTAAGGMAIPMVGIIPPDRQPWALPESDTIKQDVNKAKQLLAEAGYPNGFKAELLTQSTWVYSDLALVIKGQFAKIGVDVNVKTLEMAQYYNKIYTFDYAMNVHVMSGSEEPDEYISPYFSATATYYRWGNLDLQKKIDDQRKIMDQRKRIQAIHEIQRIIQDEGCVAPVYITKYVLLLQPRVRNFNRPWNQYNFAFEQEVWLAE